MKGVRKGRKCVAPPRGKTNARSCTGQVKVATVRATLKARLTVVATDAAGNSTTTTLALVLKN